MPPRVQVQCIRKPSGHYDPYTRMDGIGGFHNGQRWYMTTDRAISAILNREYEFFVRVSGREADVIVAEREGHLYLKTEADTTRVDNLLELPECPRL